MRYSWSKRIWRLRLWVAGEGDERHLYPQCGALNREPDEIPEFFVEDGELTVYVSWWLFEISLLLKERPAQCIQGDVAHRPWWNVNRK